MTFDYFAVVGPAAAGGGASSPQGTRTSTYNVNLVIRSALHCGFSADPCKG